jgi:Omp85 superfamily domain
MIWLFMPGHIFAQIDGIPLPLPPITADTIVKRNAIDTIHYSNQKDVVDLYNDIFKNGEAIRKDTGNVRSRALRVSAVPAAGYTLQTNFAGIVTANGAFYTRPDANQSTILTSFTYTVRNQIILPLQMNLWTLGNKYNVVIDWRYLYFPSYTYGLGGFTTADDGYIIDYSTIHLHQALLRQLAEDMYAGVGYNMDYYWGIREVNPPGNKVTDFEAYGLTSTEFASGFTFNFLYDTRKNSINPLGGSFVNVIYRPNLTIFGNTSDWRSLVVDLRKYVRFPQSTNNVLAFWSYEWLTINGKPPYLMLPNTGGDPYSNTGRGYIQGRFRGNNMAYVEGEYRMQLTHNGLLGGVIFANAQSFTETTSNRFETIAPGWGAGLRLKINKFSRTNVALDYGFGLNGSGGVFVNLGEVF